MPKKLTYKKAILYLFSLEKFGINLGLERITALLHCLNNPQDDLHVIHVAGTNGKGSTSAIIASILIRAGYKVGLYTSPHLVRFNERIKINGKDISDRIVAELVDSVKKRSKKIEVRKQNFTFFEFTTAMAYLYFAEEKVDFAIMEVGLGGRLDATNVGSPIISIITNIEKDHEAMLGNSIRDISFEKAGIVRKDGILISAETKPHAINVFKSECKRKKAKYYRINKDFFIVNNKKVCNKFSFKGRRWFFSGLKMNLPGRHQYMNAACGLAGLEILEENGFKISESAVRKGLKDAYWPGRLEIVSKKPLIVLDCAHNPAGASVLRDALENCFNYKRLFFVLGIMSDKDIKGILSKLAPIADLLIFTRPQVERAASSDLLYAQFAECMRHHNVGDYFHMIRQIEDVKDACLYAISKAAPGDVICITGSVFTVGEARKALLKLQIEKCKKAKL